MALTVLVVPAATEADQITSRKATLSDSASASTTDNVAFSFTFASSYTVKGIKFELCDSPLQSVTCVVPGTGTLANASTTIGAVGAQCASFAYASKGATSYVITYATGNAVTNASTCTATVNGLTNPNTANTQFYLRVTTYTDTALTLPAVTGQDYGAIAVSTTQVMSVQANVQENLVFCVGVSTTGGCGGISGTSITLSPNPLTTASVSSGTAVMLASTNGISGYSISYNGTTFTNTTSDTIASAPSGGAASAPGTEQFGFTLRAQTSGGLNGLGSEPTGGIGTFAASYNLQNSTIAYNTPGPTTVASAAGASVETKFTMLYAANVNGTTKAGSYTATQTYIATATF